MSYVDKSNAGNRFRRELIAETGQSDISNGEFCERSNEASTSDYRAGGSDSYSAPDAWGSSGGAFQFDKSSASSSQQDYDGGYSESASRSRVNDLTVQQTIRSSGGTFGDSSSESSAYTYVEEGTFASHVDSLAATGTYSLDESGDDRLRRSHLGTVQGLTTNIEIGNLLQLNKAIGQSKNTGVGIGRIELNCDTVGGVTG